MNRYNENMKLWLFDLAHNNLDDVAILKGFIQHYVLFDCSLSKVQDDIFFHTCYGSDGITTAITNLKRVLSNFSD